MQLRKLLFGVALLAIPAFGQLAPPPGSGTFVQLSGDASSTATGGATVVNGLKGVPFCTGFTPTNGQAVTYTTGGAPNPCYAASTLTGAPGGSNLDVQVNNSGAFGGNGGFTYNITGDHSAIGPASSIDQSNPWWTFGVTAVPAVLSVAQTDTSAAALASGNSNSGVMANMTWSPTGSIPSGAFNNPPIGAGVNLNLDGGTNAGTAANVTALATGAISNGNTTAWGNIDASQLSAYSEGNANGAGLAGAVVTAEQDGTGTITNLYGVYINARPAAGHVTSAYGLEAIVNNSGSTVTNAYGVHVPAIAGATNNWGFYSAGTEGNFLGGPLTISPLNVAGIVTNTSGGLLGTEALVTPAQGGTGHGNTATLTLGTSNQNWATIGTGIVKATTTTGAISDASGSDVVTLVQGLSGCSTPSNVFTPQSGTCVAAGTGNTTSTALTTNFIPKANGANSVINSGLDDGATTASTLTYAGGGGIASAGPVASTPPSGDAGLLSLIGNTVNQTCPTNQFCIFGFSSASATAYGWQPSTTAPSGTQFVTAGTPSSGASAIGYVSSTGTGNVVLASSPTLTTAVLGSSTATTQSAGDNSTKVATTAYVDASGVHTVVDTSSPVTVSTSLAAEQHFNEDATAATAITYNLPTAAAGKQFCFSNAYNGSAANTGVLTVATSATGQFIIFTDGTLSATGGNVTSGGAARDSACVIGVDSTHWALFVQVGTWTKH